MPTFDQVKAEFDAVARDFPEEFQTKSLRQALSKWGDYALFRANNVDDRKKLEAAKTTRKEWRKFWTFLKKGGSHPGLEAGTIQTLNSSTVARAAGKCTASSTGTLAAIKTTHRADPVLNTRVADTCGKCGAPTRSHTTDQCHVTEEEAAKGLALHAKLTATDSGFLTKMDAAQALGLKPSESGVFRPGEWHCKLCAREGEARGETVREDHWQRTCPLKPKNKQRDANHGQQRSGKRVSFAALLDSTPNKKRKKGKKRNRAQRDQRDEDDDTITMSSSELLALARMPGDKKTSKKIRKIIKESKRGRIDVGDHDVDDVDADSD